jgi:hypothetical protein
MRQAARAQCVAAVWQRERIENCESVVAHCQHPGCGKLIWPLAYAAGVFSVGHVHEVIPRSLGGDPHDPDNGVLVCPNCHDKLTHHELAVRKQQNGLLVWTRRQHGARESGTGDDSPV